MEYKRSPGSATGQATPAAADAEAPPEGTKKRRWILCMHGCVIGYSDELLCYLKFTLL